MGQYYTPLLFSADKPISAKSFICSFDPHHFVNGAKLTEHSFFGNNLVNTIIATISKLGKARLVWAGDYADKVKRIDLYKKFNSLNNIKEEAIPEKEYRYMVNHTKKECVNLDEYPRKYTTIKYEANGNTFYPVPCEGDMLHPLPLLTCIGNGRGGGDYYPKYGSTETAEYVGRWAGDVISFSDDKPDDTYTEISPIFIDGQYDLASEMIANAKTNMKYIKKLPQR